MRIGEEESPSPSLKKGGKEERAVKRESWEKKKGSHIERKVVLRNQSGKKENSFVGAEKEGKH